VLTSLAKLYFFPRTCKPYGVDAFSVTISCVPSTDARGRNSVHYQKKNQMEQGTEAFLVNIARGTEFYLQTQIFKFVMSVNHLRVC
jgi:hypothetical protein